jgi:hypothetical protein
VGCSLKDFAVTVQLYNKEFQLPPEQRAYGVSTAFSRFMDSGGLRRAVELVGKSPDLLQTHKGLSMLNELRRPKPEEELSSTAVLHWLLNLRLSFSLSWLREPVCF